MKGTFLMKYIKRYQNLNYIKGNKQREKNKAPKYFYLEASSLKTATTYSPTVAQYHRRDEA